MKETNYSEYEEEIAHEEAIRIIEEERQRDYEYELYKNKKYEYSDVIERFNKAIKKKNYIKLKDLINL